ncbi:transposase IS3/IS911 family protein [Listeria grayi FSL F6-1183]|uniref:Transposase IS3/IS911 family protein n=1 Tax=Listeria grayi FSL F6-1183 TaxID=1265827 RepID=A0A829R7Z0_LISGR|nr:transposase IS3/IS911 family protein [Listeria grayi FSL F6-1183]
MKILKKSLVNLYNGGKIQAALCKEYGVSQTALSRWIKLYSEVQMDSGELLTVKQVRELQKQKALLEEENLILKKSHCHLHATLQQRLKAISLLAADHSIVRLCQVLRVNRSTYYKFLSKIPSAVPSKTNKSNGLFYRLIPRQSLDSAQPR